ncbi:MAG: hypothetical protein ROO76_02705 [Terriglobia bacterium]|jgi:hypothetical protein|nr:hypothetical protein [Terriglobia bacterium]
MRYKLETLAFLWISLLASAMGQQQSKAEPLPRALALSSTTLTQVPVFGWSDDVQCDGSGNLYFHAPGLTYNRSDIFELSADGGRGKTFSLPDEMAQKTAFVGFSVSSGGSLRVLAESRKGVLAFTFGRDGRVTSETSLEIPEDVTVNAFADSESGSVVVVGYFNKRAKGAIQGKPYAALFAPSGKVQTVFSELKGKVELRDVHDKLMDGAAAVGEGGTIYLLRSGEVIVLSASGTIQRHMRFSQPVGSAATQLRLSEGLLSVTLSTLPKPGSGNKMLKRQYLVLNSFTGDEYGLYEPSEELGNMDVCFSRQNGFTFIRTTETGVLKLMQATMK